MSTYSWHHQLRAPLQDVINELMAWSWVQRDTESVELKPLSSASPGELDILGLADPAHLLVSWDGWTAVWSGQGHRDEAWVSEVAGALRCDALYGHNNDGVDNWRWITFEAGRRVQEFWYLGQPEYADWRMGRGELPQPYLYDAFRLRGRSYEHHSLSAAAALCRGKTDATLLIRELQKG